MQIYVCIEQFQKKKKTKETKKKKNTLAIYLLYFI